MNFIGPDFIEGSETGQGGIIGKLMFDTSMALQGENSFLGRY